MVSKQEAQRRLQAQARAEAASERSGGRKKRRQRWTIGILAAFLSLAMILPLISGLLTLGG